MEILVGWLLILATAVCVGMALWWAHGTAKQGYNVFVLGNVIKYFEKQRGDAAQRDSIKRFLEKDKNP